MAIKGKNMVDLKQSNRAAILMLLHEQGGMSRKQLAAWLRLTPPAITTIVSELIEDGLVCEVRVLDNKSAGRKEILLDIDGANLFAIGVSFGIENAVISATDIKGNLLSSETFLFDYDSGAEYIINKVCSFVKKAVTQREQQGKTCIGIGVSVRGITNEPMGICENSHGAWPDLNVPVRSMVQASLPGHEIIMMQNVRALAETYIFDNHDEVIESMLLVKNDTGIGSAMVINHKIYIGCHSRSAEMGHITIEKGGKLCKCGSRGCLESFASHRAIVANVTEIYGAQNTPALYAMTGGRADNITFDQVTGAIAQGDMRVKQVVDTGIGHFGRVLREHIGVLDVQKVVLHGTIFHNSYFYNRLKEEINFDNRYTNMDELLVITEDVNSINIKCSPVLVIKSFLSKGGRMEQRI